MTIEINRPEIEALVQQRLHSGAFESVEDVLLDALEMQADCEAWLQENKEAISAKIAHGLAQLDRGKGYRERTCASALSLTRRLGLGTALSRKIVRVAPDAESELQQIWRYSPREAGLAVAGGVSPRRIQWPERHAAVGNQRI